MLCESRKCEELAEAGDMLDMETISGDCMDDMPYCHPATQYCSSINGAFYCPVSDHPSDSGRGSGLIDLFGYSVKRNGFPIGGLRSELGGKGK